MVAFGVAAGALVPGLPALPFGGTAGTGLGGAGTKP